MSLSRWCAGLVIATGCVQEPDRAPPIRTDSMVVTEIPVAESLAIAPTIAIPTVDSIRSPTETDSSAALLTATASDSLSLMIPVEGVAASELRDTFGDPRTGHAHEALDIMAPRGTPVLSATNGRLTKLHLSKQGGNMVYAADATDRYVLMYAHLDRYAAGLTEGMPLRRGQLIGYVGSTGDASPAAPHLHFAIARGQPSVAWWKGVAVNPYPLLAPSKSSSGPVAMSRDTPPPADLTIEASDFSFRAPSRAQAGWTTIRLQNQGPSYHHVVLLRMKPGAARDSVLARVTRRQGDPDGAIVGSVSVGGPEGQEPTGDSFTTVNLVPGEYLIICMIPDEHGALHAKRGMSAPLTVVAGATPPRSPPKSVDLSVRMTNYAYTLSSESVPAGWRTLRIENAGTAEHIAELARLKDGRTVADMFKASADSDPPTTTIGGSSRLAAGAVSYVHAQLSPGRYVLLCMLEDPSHHRHVRLGMVKEFTVR